MKSRMIASAMALLTASLSAQTAKPSAKSCDVPVAHDSSEVTISLVLWTAPPEVAEIANSYRYPKRDLTMIAESLLPHLTAPPAMSLAVTSTTPLRSAGERDALGVPDIGSGIAFVVRRSGDATAIRPHRYSPVPQLDSLLLSAVEKASTNSDFTGSFVETRADTLAIWAELAEDDSSKRAHAIPIFRLRVPRYLMTKARPVTGGSNPAFPDAAGRAGASDVVELEFVVGPDGKADPNRSRVRRGRYLEFMAEVLKALPTMRYQPATVQGCPQAAWVRQPFTFRN